MCINNKRASTHVHHQMNAKEPQQQCASTNLQKAKKPSKVLGDTATRISASATSALTDTHIQKLQKTAQPSNCHIQKQQKKR
jgi:hypothetical protein